MGDVLRSVDFISGLEKGLQNTVCSLFNKYTGKAKSVIEKLKTSVN
jgi:hypothetical protein